LNIQKCGSWPGSRFLLILAAGLYLSACAGSRPAFDVPPGTEDPLTPARIALASGNETSAIERLNDFLRDNPGSALVDEATYLLGRAHLATKDSDSRVLAADYFQRVLRDYPQSRFACDASYYLAEAYEQLSRPSQLDQDWTFKALSAYQQFITSCPERPEVASAGEKIRSLNDRLAKKAYENGVTYMKLKLYSAASVYFKKSLDEHPESQWACRAAVGLGDSYIRMRKWTEASSQLQKVVDTCPDQKLVSHAKDLLAKARTGLAQNPPAPPDTSGAPDSASTP
jgi:outer membrane assembly lipoprotein YfiO